VGPGKSSGKKKEAEHVWLEFPHAEQASKKEVPYSEGTGAESEERLSTGINRTRKKRPVSGLEVKYTSKDRGAGKKTYS